MKVLGSHKIEFLTAVVNKAGLTHHENVNFFSPSIKDIPNLENVINTVNTEEGNVFFVWGDSTMDSTSLGSIEQTLKSSKTKNIFYIKTNSIIRFVEDVRIVINNNQVKIRKETKKDFCLVYNSLDQEQAKNVEHLLKDVADFSTINYDQSTGESLLAQIEEKAIDVPLIVVLFYTQIEWSKTLLPELWKMIGGGSSKSKILMICPEETKFTFEQSNLSNVYYESVVTEMIPLEIKMKYDNL